jgi:Pentapeptide repeats (8 copies)
MLNSLRPIAFAAVAASVASLALATGAFAKPSGAFSSKPVVKSLEVSCVTRGELRGRVIVDTRVRYGDARSASRFARGRHLVRSSLELRSLGGALLVRDSDKGTAQVDIPAIKAYVHSHRHVLSRTVSQDVLDGQACGEGPRPAVRVSVQVKQALSAGKGRAVASAATSQSAKGVTTASVDPTASPGTAINGCLVAGSDFNCRGVDLSGRDLTNVSIAFGDFSFANLKNANLQGERMGHVIMERTVLDGADMREALFGVATLTSASLIGTDLTGAVGIYSNLANTTFSGAHLDAVDLTGANLVGTKFESTTCNDFTRFPAAFPHACNSGLITG